MNKKIISASLALSICVMAIAPIFEHINISATNDDIALASIDQSLLDNLILENQPIATYDDSSDSENTELENNNSIIEEETNENNTKSRAVSSSTNASTSKKTESSTKTSVSTSTNKTTNKTNNKPSTSTSSNSSTSSSSSSSSSSSTQSSSSSSSSSNTSTNRGDSSTVTSSKANAIISTAKSFLGVPYLWGGVSPSGFDCSGYTQYVLKKNGISVPRTAAEQYKVGTTVSKSNLRIGDLVFFTTYKAGPSHLGFYIGNGNFIHCSSSKGVIISNLSSTYYSSRYIGARRVIK